MSSRKITVSTFILSLAIMSCMPATTPALDDTPGPGQRVINHFIDLFIDDWAIGMDYDENMDGMGYGQNYDVHGSPAFTPFIRGEANIATNMTITPILSPTNSEDATIELINSARESLYIEQMYIHDDLDEILSAVINAHDRGVNVLVIQGDLSYTENNASGNMLESAGITVKRLEESSSLPYPVPFDTQHNKGIIVDNETVLIASINWSPTSLRDNREAGLIIESPEVALYYTDLFMHDWNGSEDYNSIPVTFTPTNPRPNPDLESFSGEMHVTCLASPDNCFTVVNAMLASANESIWVSVYTLSSPYLMETLRDRIADGVDVKLLLEKNQLNANERAYNRWSMVNMTVLGVDHDNNASTANLTAGGRWASSTFDFQHCKYAVIDNKTLVLSSGNWGRSSCPRPQDDGDVDGNRDWWFVIHGDGKFIPGGEPDGTIDLPWWTWIIIAAAGFIGGAIIQSRTKNGRGPAKPRKHLKPRKD